MPVTGLGRLDPASSAPSSEAKEPMSFGKKLFWAIVVVVGGAILTAFVRGKFL